MTKVSLSLDDEVWEQTAAAAAADGLTPSAYVTRVLRRAHLRQAAAEHDAWLAAHPEARAPRDSWRRMTGLMAAARRGVRTAAESGDPGAADAARIAQDALAAEIASREGTDR